MHDGSRRSAEAATFVVVATGVLGTRIVQLAEEHAAYDPNRRRVVKPGDPRFPSPAHIAHWCANDTVAALILNPQGELCQRLDPERALVDAWVEDAFVRARR